MSLDAERNTPPASSLAPYVPLLQALYDGQEGKLDLRAVAPGQPAVQELVTLDPGAGAAVRDFVRRYSPTHSIYFGVATRKPDATRGTLADCQTLTAFWVDIDFKDTPEREARERLARSPLPPSAVVHSGGGLHVYWFLSEPLSLTDAASVTTAQSTLLGLAAAFGGDRASAEPARMLRLPGTLNPKYDPPRETRLEMGDV